MGHAAEPADRAGVLYLAGVTRPVGERPLVIDFSSLWAGPLCAHLLGRCGADVVKVESLDRPTVLVRARAGSTTFSTPGIDPSASTSATSASLESYAIWWQGPTW